MIQVNISGINRTDMIIPGSLTVPDRVGERSEASFMLKLPAGGTWHPLPFAPVTVYLDGVLVFEGFVWDEEEERLALMPGAMPLLAPIKCVDLHMLADRRIVAETYDNMTAGAIFMDIIAKYLAVDGVTYGGIQPGPLVTRAVFNYQNASQCFDELAELAGFVWQITPGRAAHFFDRSLNAAPWAINADAPLTSLKVRRHRERYRNRQYLRAGMGTSDPRTDKFKGNGQDKTYTCVYPLAKKPSFKVNGVAVADSMVGIRGLDKGKAWYWQKNDAVVSHDDTVTPLSATDTLDVIYQGLFPLVAQADSTSEIGARAAEEGGSGIYEEVEQDASLDDQNAALEFANARLQQFARLNGEIVFTTRTAGLRAGQLLTVDLPEHGIAGTFLISEATLSDDGAGVYGIFSYAVRAVDGTSVGGWIDFFKRLAQAGKSFVIRENEVLVRLQRFSDGLKLSDSLTNARAAPVRTVGSAIVGYSEVG